MAIGLQTYMDTSRRESLLSVLKDVSALQGNYLMANLGTSTADNTYHEWPVYNQTRATSVTSVIEGADATVADLTQPSRSGNVTAIISEVVLVTGTEMAVDTATHEDPWAFQKRKAMERLTQKQEWLTLRGQTFASGSSGVARQMLGIYGVISTHLTARNSGTSMSVTEIEDIMQEIWQDTSDTFNGSTLIVPIVTKRAISGFTTNVTNYVNQTDKLYRNISTFQGSTGEIKVVPHRDARTTAGTVTVVLINEDMYKVAYLKGREPKCTEHAISGDYKKGQYLTEQTLESRAQRTSALRTGYITTVS